MRIWPWSRFEELQARINSLITRNNKLADTVHEREEEIDRLQEAVMAIRMDFNRADRLFQERDAQYANVLTCLGVGTDPCGAILAMRTNHAEALLRLRNELDTAKQGDREGAKFIEQIEALLGQGDPFAQIRKLQTDVAELTKQVREYAST